MAPEIKSRWVGKDNTFGPLKPEFNAYTVIAIANTAHASEKYPPTVIYLGDNGHWWAKKVSDWPGSLIPF